MDPNTVTGRPTETWDEQMKLAFQKAKEEFDPERFEREFLATTEWVPMELLLKQLDANLREVSELFPPESR